MKISGFDAYGNPVEEEIEIIKIPWWRKLEPWWLFYIRLRLGLTRVKLIKGIEVNENQSQSNVDGDG